MIAQLNGGTSASTETPSKRFPKAADIETQIETRGYRRRKPVSDNAGQCESEDAGTDAAQADASRLL